MKKFLNIFLLLILSTFRPADAQSWDKEYETAKSNYLSGDYTGAASKLEVLLKNSKIEDDPKAEIKNLYAVCLLNSGKAQDGVNAFLENISFMETNSKRSPSENYYTATSQLGIILFKAKQPENAVTYLQKSLVEAQNLDKKTDSEIITITQIIATVYKDEGKVQKADSIYSIVLNQKAEFNGSESEELKKTLVTVANMHYDNDDFDKAVQYYNKAAEISEKLYGTKSQECVTINQKIAEIYRYNGKLEEAEKIYSKSLRTYKKEYGEQSPQYLSAFISLADLYMITGRYSKAEDQYEEARKLLKSLTGENNEEYARLLNQIGLLKAEIGEYNLALDIYNRSLSITKKVLGENHKEYATTLHNIALAYQNLENYIEAEQTYKTALQIRKNTTGETSPEYAESANSLAAFYIKMGRTNDALKYFQAAHKIIESNYGVNNIRYATSLTNLGHVFELNNEHNKALEFYNGAISIFENAIGTSHPLYGDAISNLAKLYLKESKYDEAEALFQKYRTITKKKYGTDHEKYSLALTNLGRLNEKTENYKKALDYYLEVKEIAQNKFGEKSMVYNEAISNLARVETAMGNIASAKAYWLEANRIYFYEMASFFPSMSEKEQSRFYNKIRYHFVGFNMFVYQYQKQHPDLLIHLFENQIISKSMLFRSSSKMIEGIRKSNNPETLKYFEDWQSNKELLAQYYTDPNISVSKEKKDSLESYINELEKQLSLSSAQFKDYNSSGTVDFKSIQSNLNPTEALIEMVRVEKFDFQKGGTRDTNNVYYLALIITSNASQPKLVFINNGKDLETGKLKNYRNSTKYKVPDQKSYAMYWERIKKELPDNNNQIYLSPDGVYNQINLLSIRNPTNNNYIIDEVNIKYITNSSEVVQKAPKSDLKVINLYGNPDFSYHNKLLQKTQPKKSREIKDLPGTKVEIDIIQSQLEKAKWDINKFEATNATETSLKKTQNAQVIHIATHGFFKEDVKIEGEDDGDHFLNNPLLRSGLYLSKNEQIRDENSGDDGILYAYEAMNLNLDNTELVVLSACETGLGEVQNGEGVFGLQRALRVAGCQSVLISLWKVDDTATQELMEAFYAHWLKTGDKFEALRTAQKAVRKKYNNPYYWGGFIMVGI